MQTAPTSNRRSLMEFRSAADRWPRPAQAVVPRTPHTSVDDDWTYFTDWTQRNTVSLAIAVLASINLVALILL